MFWKKVKPSDVTDLRQQDANHSELLAVLRDRVGDLAEFVGGLNDRVDKIHESGDITKSTNEMVWQLSGRLEKLECQQVSSPDVAKLRLEMQELANRVKAIEDKPLEVSPIGDVLDEPAVCLECRHCVATRDEGFMLLGVPYVCGGAKLPRRTNYVTGGVVYENPDGVKHHEGMPDCRTVNTDGNCPYFEEK